MASYTLHKKIHEKFFCHCGKECKPIKVAKTKDTTDSGMFWRCEDEHYARHYAKKVSSALG